ncbi:MAG: Gfo/Idh/MocA family oxidoreductase [Pirellulales bacterium]
MPTDRRGFLGAGLGLVAAGVAHAADKSTDADRTLRVLVIGSGGRGSDLIRSLVTIEGASIVGVCDDYPPHLAKGLEYAGKQAEGFSSHTDALKKLSPDAVVIAVPLHLHYKIALDAFAAGAAVFCEKTMCSTIDDALKLHDHVVEKKLIFQVGLQRRANPIYIQAQAMIESGILGRIVSIEAQWHRNNSWRRPLPVPRDNPEWPALERKLNWRLYREYSGGLMTELGSHQMDVANWLLGTVPKRVMATGGIDFWRDGRDVYDNIFCVYEYELPLPEPASAAKNSTDPGKTLPDRSGPIGVAEANAKTYTVRATYSSLCNNAYEGASELIMGTNGSLYLTSGKGLFYRENAPAKIDWAAGGDGGQRAKKNADVVTAGATLKLSNDPWAHRGKPLEIDNDSGDDTRGELNAFLDNVRRGDPATIADAKTGLADAATVILANHAAEQGKAVEFPDDVRKRLT